MTLSKWTKTVFFGVVSYLSEGERPTEVLSVMMIDFPAAF